MWWLDLAHAPHLRPEGPLMRRGVFSVNFALRQANALGLVARVLRVGSRPSVKMKNSDAPAVKREAEEDWGRRPALIPPRER
jgi:hypothetical protein